MALAHALRKGLDAWFNPAWMECCALLPEAHKSDRQNSGVIKSTWTLNVFNNCHLRLFREWGALAADKLMRKFWKFIWLRGNAPHPVGKVSLKHLMAAFKFITKYLLKPEGEKCTQLHPFFSFPLVKAHPWDKAHGKRHFPSCEVIATFM